MIVILGEVHDNPAHHDMQTAVVDRIEPARNRVRDAHRAPRQVS
jgi:uncharacterized iron-regulated protein